MNNYIKSFFFGEVEPDNWLNFLNLSVKSRHKTKSKNSWVINFYQNLFFLTFKTYTTIGRIIHKEGKIECENYWTKMSYGKKDFDKLT